MALCACGCGQETKICTFNLKTGKYRYVKGQPMRYIHGHGARAPRKLSMEDRFWAKVQKTGGCWLWVGAKADGGYGSFWHSPERGHIKASRLSYELAYGTIPADKPNVLHTCDTPACVRPDHLFAGTLSENTFDMWQKKRGPKKKPFCRNGHPKTPETSTKKGYCRICKNRVSAAHEARKKATQPCKPESRFRARPPQLPSRAE